MAKILFDKWLNQPKPNEGNVDKIIYHLKESLRYDSNNYEVHLSDWTARELAEEIEKQGIIDSRSPRHVGRLLEEAE